MTRVLSAVARDAGIYVAAARGPVGPPRLEDDARVRAPMLAARRLEDAGEAAQDRAAGRSVGERPVQERGRELLVRVDGEHVRRRRDVKRQIPRAADVPRQILGDADDDDAAARRERREDVRRGVARRAVVDDEEEQFREQRVVVGVPRGHVPRRVGDVAVVQIGDREFRRAGVQRVVAAEALRARRVGRQRRVGADDGTAAPSLLLRGTRGRSEEE